VEGRRGTVGALLQRVCRTVQGGITDASQLLLLASSIYFMCVSNATGLASLQTGPAGWLRAACELGMCVVRWFPAVRHGLVCCVWPSLIPLVLHTFVGRSLLPCFRHPVCPPYLLITDANFNDHLADVVHVRCYTWCAVC
jgi:hypothetical protein